MSRTLCLDFDGVLHRYTGWNGGLLNEPLAGALWAVKSLLSQEFEVVVYTTRDSKTVEEWLRDYAFPPLTVTRVKPLCLVTLDDRAVCFGGEWSPELLNQLTTFRPYWESAA